MSSVTFSIRLDTTTLKLIDIAAQRAGESRSTYILSWVPEYHDTPRTPTERNTQTHAEAAPQSQRVP